MTILKQKLKKANEALTFINHIQFHLDNEFYPKIIIYPKKVICKICNTTINEISKEENNDPVTELIKEWLQRCKIELLKQYKKDSSNSLASRISHCDELLEDLKK